jgi:hypothetical protein
MSTLFRLFKSFICFLLIFAFLSTSVYIPEAKAGELVLPVMPAPGSMVSLSNAYIPAHLMGMTIHPDNALRFDFLIHKGDVNLTQDQKKQEYTKLVKYFLASLTIPDKDQWVNLSPYEHNRIITDNFGKTEMGRDLLEEDYLLKQITSSLMYPESGLGKVFWDKVYQRAYQLYGNTNIPVNTFNKVWIVPDQATVYESKNTAYIIQSHLKVMLEEDFLSLSRHSDGVQSTTEESKGVLRSFAKAQVDKTHTVGSQVIREIILPALEKEVNEGKNFAQLRQIVSGMILATWYKKVLKESLLGKIYADKAKVKGISQDPKTNEEIYQQYLQAFKKGVYNYIKEDENKYTHQTTPRKYFAGGFVRGQVEVISNLAMMSELRDAAMNAFTGTATTTGKVSVILNQDVNGDFANDRAQMGEVELKDALTATGLLGKQWDKLKKRDAIEQLLLGKNAENFKIARTRINDQNLGQIKYLIEGDLFVDFHEYFLSDPRIKRETDPKNFPEVIKGSFYGLVREFLFASEIFFTEKKGVLTKLLKADEETITMQAKNAENTDIIVIYNIKERSTQIHLLTEYQKEESVEPETDLNKLADAQETIKDVVEFVLAGKDDVEKISDPEWQVIAQKIYSEMHQMYKGGLVNKTFLVLLKEYLSTDELATYVARFLFKEGKLARRLSVNDLVFIVEYLHTASLSLSELELRPEVSKFVTLYWLIAKIGFTFKFYRDTLHEQKWIGQTWENAPIDQQVVNDLKSRTAKVFELDTISKLKSFAYTYSIDVPVFYKKQFRLLMYQYGPQIIQSILEEGKISDNLRQEIGRHFNHYILQSFLAFIAYKAKRNDIIISGVVSATPFGAILSGEYDPLSEQNKLVPPSGVVSGGASTSVILSLVDVPSSRLQYKREPIPIHIIYDDLPTNTVNQRIEILKAIKAVKNAQRANPNPNQAPLPFTHLVTYYYLPLTIRIDKNEVNAIVPDAFDRFAGFRESFQVQEDGESGRIINIPQFMKNVENAFRKERSAKEAILAFLNPIVADHQTVLFTATDKFDENARLYNIIAEDRKALDVRRPFQWALDYMKMIEAFYQNKFLNHDNNLFNFYYDGQDLKTNRVLGLAKLTNENERNPIYKHAAAFNILYMFLGIEFDLRIQNVPWDIVKEIARHDYKGEALQAILELIDFLEAEYISSSTMGDFIHNWNARTQPLFQEIRGDAAMLNGKAIQTHQTYLDLLHRLVIPLNAAQFKTIVDFYNKYYADLDSNDQNVVLEKVIQLAKKGFLESLQSGNGGFSDILIEKSRSLADLSVHADKKNKKEKRDRAMVDSNDRYGGIDLNSANLAMTIKRDGNGVPLPLNQQDMAQLSNIQGFEPHILEITPATNLPILEELKQRL